MTAVFAADAVARLSGCVGVAAVTAGPGLTNTVTAVKNAQMAESPVLLIGGAAASLLKVILGSYACRPSILYYNTQQFIDKLHVNDVSFARFFIKYSFSPNFNMYQFMLTALTGQRCLTRHRSDVIIQTLVQVLCDRQICARHYSHSERSVACRTIRNTRCVQISK